MPCSCCETATTSARCRCLISTTSNGLSCAPWSAPWWALVWAASRAPRRAPSSGLHRPGRTDRRRGGGGETGRRTPGWQLGAGAGHRASLGDTAVTVREAGGVVIGHRSVSVEDLIALGVAIGVEAEYEEEVAEGGNEE